MTWNYTVVEEDDQLRIYDVYYNEAGEPIARNEQPTYVYGEDVEELKTQLCLMLEALDKPVLKMNQIGTEPCSHNTLDHD